MRKIILQNRKYFCFIQKLKDKCCLSGSEVDVLLDNNAEIYTAYVYIQLIACILLDLTDQTFIDQYQEVQVLVLSLFSLPPLFFVSSLGVCRQFPNKILKIQL